MVMGSYFALKINNLIAHKQSFLTQISVRQIELRAFAPLEQTQSNQGEDGLLACQ